MGIPSYAMGRLLPILFVVNVILVVAALISCLSAEEEDIRALPRLFWVLIILLFSPVGAIAWFLAGKEPRGGQRHVRRPGSGSPEPNRPRRTVAPDDDPEFLRRLESERAQQDAARRDKEEQEMLRKWEEDLRRREEDLRKKDNPEE